MTKVLGLVRDASTMVDQRKSVSLTTMPVTSPPVLPPLAMSAGVPNVLF